MSEIQLRVVSYDLKGAVEATGISRTTIWEATGRGDLIANYVGRKPVYRAVELDRWIASLPTESTKQVAS